MTPQDFIAKWGAPGGVPGPAYALNEEQGSRSHFLGQPDKLALLRRIWSAPERFEPEETNRDIAEAAAKSFATLAEGLRRRGVNTLPRSEQTPSPHTLRFLKSAPTSAPSTPGGSNSVAASAEAEIANRIAHLEALPFPAGLTPADTAHQRTETLPGGAVIPADIYMENQPVTHINKAQEATNTIVNLASEPIRPNDSEVGVVRMSVAISKSEAYEPPTSEPAPPGEPAQSHASAEVASSTQSVQKVKIAKTRPVPLLFEHAIAAAYGWADYTAVMPDDEILKRLLALNLARSGGGVVSCASTKPAAEPLPQA